MLDRDGWSQLDGWILSNSGSRDFNERGACVNAQTLLRTSILSRGVVEKASMSW